MAEKQKRAHHEGGGEEGDLPFRQNLQADRQA